MHKQLLHHRTWRPISVVLLVAVAVVAYLVWSGARTDVRNLHVHELPGVSADVLDAQGVMIRVQEPFPYCDETGMASFEIEVLQTAGFVSSNRFSFVGNAQSLQLFLNEVRLVNGGASRGSNFLRGGWDGITSMIAGIWHLLRHPIDTVTSLGAASLGLAVYAWETPFAQMQSDITSLVMAVYHDWACKVAEGHGVNYLEIQIPEARAIVESDTHSQMVGRALTEVVLVLIPLSKAEYVTQASKAGRFISGTEVAVEIARAGDSGTDALSLSRALQFTPDLIPKAESASKRAALVRQTRSALTASATARSARYRETFFKMYPHLEGKVVVHHAVEQQVLKRYPGVMSEDEIHALSNLRGIPKSSNNDLHLSAIRKEWNEFYKTHPPGTVTKGVLEQKAMEIDRKYGHKFDPPMTKP